MLESRTSGQLKQVTERHSRAQRTYYRYTHSTTIACRMHAPFRHYGVKHIVLVPYILIYYTPSKYVLPTTTNASHLIWVRFKDLRKIAHSSSQT